MSRRAIAGPAFAWLCIPVLGWVGGSPLRAQAVVLERYEVSTRRPAAVSPVQVSHSELRAHLPVDVGALLGREVSSIAPVRRGGVASDILLRGLGRDDVTVLLDGSPAHAACPGRMDPPVFHVSTPLLERISVQAGPFDVRHGSAPGGSVAVTSAEAPAERLATASLLAGSAELMAADFAVGGRVAPAWRVLLGGSYHEGLAYRNGAGLRFTELAGLNYRPEIREGRAFAIAHGELHATWEPASGHTLTLRTSFNDARDVLYPALMMDAQKDRSTRVAVGWNSSTPRAFADRWRVDVHHHRVDHDMSDAFRSSSLGAWSARGYMMRTVARTTIYGVAGEAELSRPFADLVYGVQLSGRNWIADNVIGPVTNAMLPDATTWQAGVYVQGERARGPWKMKAGLRVDAWRTGADRDIAVVQRAHGTSTRTREDLASTGFALAERAMTDGSAVFAGVGEGARVPDPQERYIQVDRAGPGTDWVGDPDLPLVRATELTAGGRLKRGGLRLTARVFRSWLGNHVVLGRLSPAPGSTANPARTETYVATDATLTGAEIQCEVRLAEHWHLGAAAAGQRGRRRGALPAEAERDLPEIPPWRGRFTLRWADHTTWIEAEVPWAARQTRLDEAVGERPLAGYGVLHLRAERSLNEHLTVSLGWENVFDRSYASHNAYTRDPFAAGLIVPEPGRTFYVRLHWRR